METLSPVTTPVEPVKTPVEVAKPVTPVVTPVKTLSWFQKLIAAIKGLF